MPTIKPYSQLTSGEIFDRAAEAIYHVHEPWCWEYSVFDHSQYLKCWASQFIKSLATEVATYRTVEAIDNATK